jgi:hypothetical protein
VDCYGFDVGPDDQVAGVSVPRLFPPEQHGTEICESDLRCAMTHIFGSAEAGHPAIHGRSIMQRNRLALHGHRQDGRSGQAFRTLQLRAVMERQEGGARSCLRASKLRRPRWSARISFAVTGEIVDAGRGSCRTKITVKIDGDAEKLWKNWSNGTVRPAWATSARPAAFLPPPASKC